MYYVFAHDTYLNILLTFSCSIPLIYLLQEWKTRKKLTFMLPFASAVALLYVLNRHITIDYGFWGILVPVFAALCYPSRGSSVGNTRHLCRTGLLGIGLLLLALNTGFPQFYSLLALPLVFLYSGKRGKGNFKYAFYLFYPSIWPRCRPLPGCWDNKKNCCLQRRRRKGFSLRRSCHRR